MPLGKSMQVKQEFCLTGQKAKQGTAKFYVGVILPYLDYHHPKGLEDGLVVKSTHAPVEDTNSVPSIHVGLLTAVSNVDARESESLFWPPKLLQSCTRARMHTRTCIHVHT